METLNEILRIYWIILLLPITIFLYFYLINNGNKVIKAILCFITLPLILYIGAMKEIFYFVKSVWENHNIIGDKKDEK